VPSFPRFPILLLRDPLQNLSLRESMLQLILLNQKLFFERLHRIQLATAPLLDEHHLPVGPSPQHLDQLEILDADRLPERRSAALEVLARGF
jgi:hypothetical protein